MPLQQTTTEPNELSVLVNTDRIRSSVKRLFHNKIAECAAEIFQNSQRSRARNVAIETTADGFTITDDGHGLLDGINGFHTLLKLAESAFDNSTIEDQDPMGMGIVSLMTHDEIHEVTFTSHDLELTIDLTQWWENKDYYSTWFERLTPTETTVAGFKIS